MSRCSQLEAVLHAARALGVTILPVEANDGPDIDRAFRVIEKERPGGLMILGSSLYGSHRSRIADFARRVRVPTVSTLRLDAEAGYLDKILKGARAGGLPIEQANRFELVINLETAQTLGLTIPGSLRLRADRVIE